MPANNNDENLRQAKARAFEYVSKQIQRLDGCPVCHGNQWHISDSTFAMNEVDATGLTGNVFPVVPAICATCGNVLFFSAQEAGVVDDWHFQRDGGNAR
ncbi:hypothetical protein [Bifidobacterium subtile]|jgi:predicted Zn-ribbon and HTH transcriptional regulator|uniref:hypothetical protein n=1 Tax=Bifidobacterium subtile TaxID=77635 RepID=UPI002F35C863